MVIFSCTYIYAACLISRTKVDAFKCTAEVISESRRSYGDGKIAHTSFLGLLYSHHTNAPSMIGGLSNIEMRNGSLIESVLERYKWQCVIDVEGFHECMLHAGPF